MTTHHLKTATLAVAATGTAAQAADKAAVDTLISKLKSDDADVRHEASLAVAAPQKPCPSWLGPTIAMNNSPGPTLRESIDTPRSIASGVPRHSVPDVHRTRSAISKGDFNCRSERRVRVVPRPDRRTAGGLVR